ncbi:hypothetical protein V8V91_13020 [Algoriphagus halophilus]|uniref:hypothetical protein n=1 Tax=Algoriphagus halophilus TaxID=226505 RepID=UPI00358F8169
MKISTSKGNFKIIQTVKNQDELLILGSWNDLVNNFESSRVFLVNKPDSLFGIYVCKQECTDFLGELLLSINYNEWEDFKLGEMNSYRTYLA